MKVGDLVRLKEGVDRMGREYASKRTLPGERVDGFELGLVLKIIPSTEECILKGDFCTVYWAGYKTRVIEPANLLEVINESR